MDNSKIRERLGLQLRYPTLAEGLKASLADMLKDNPNFFRDVLGKT
jgi:hypothetical protein